MGCEKPEQNPCNRLASGCDLRRRVRLGYSRAVETARGDFRQVECRHHARRVLHHGRRANEIISTMGRLSSRKVSERKPLDLNALLRTKDATVWLELANGKGVTLRDAWYAAEGTAKTKEGEIEVRFEGLSADIT